MAQIIQAQTTRIRTIWNRIPYIIIIIIIFHTSRPSVHTKPVNPLIDPLEIRVK